MIYCVDVFECLPRVARRAGQHVYAGVIDKSISALKANHDLASVALKGHLMRFTRPIGDSEILRAANRADGVSHPLIVPRS
jgi:hypothetical protein